MPKRQHKDDLDQCHNCGTENDLFRVVLRTGRVSLPNYYTLCPTHMANVARDSWDRVEEIKPIKI